MLCKLRGGAWKKSSTARSNRKTQAVLDLDKPAFLICACYRKARVSYKVFPYKVPNAVS
jgi:hypothetical protein